MQQRVKSTSNGTGWACPSGVVLDVGFTGARGGMRGNAAKLVNQTVGKEAWKAPVDLLDEYHRHRYVIHVGNNGFSDSLWHKLASGAVVVASGLNVVQQLVPAPAAAAGQAVDPQSAWLLRKMLTYASKLVAAQP